MVKLKNPETKYIYLTKMLCGIFKSDYESIILVTFLYLKEKNI